MVKKVILLFAGILFFSCSDTTQVSNCLPNIPLSITTDLNNPSLINAQTPSGHAFLNGGSKGILLFNIDGTRFVAYDRLCPNLDCDTPMDFKNGLTLECSCDNSEYSVHFQGAPQTENTDCFAREYRVIKIGTSIRITNF